MKRNEFEGRRFGRLLVIRCVGRDKYASALWECRCDCGMVGLKSSMKLRSGHTNSCGCLQRESRGQTSKTHGMSKAPEFNVWQHMRRRCYEEHNPGWDNYGGRGIKVCPQWRNSFATFFRDMGPRPTPEHCIERINNNGDYTPDNCKWGTRLEQSNNTRANRLFRLGEQTMTAAMWARKLGINETTLRERIDKQGWPIEIALTTGKLKGRRDPNNPMLHK